MNSKIVSVANQIPNINFCLKALDLGLWDYDIDADILVCSSRWYELAGRDLNSVRTLNDFRPFIHPDDVVLATSVDYDRLKKLIAADERYHVDFRIIRPDGEIRWWRSVACVLIDPESGNRKAIGCVTDNTEFRLLEVNPAGHEEYPTPTRSPEPTGPADPPHQHVASHSSLSTREVECLSWVSVGKTAWETATIMGISQRTVEFHLVNAMRKLSASNKVHAVVIAVREGLI